MFKTNSNSLLNKYLNTFSTIKGITLLENFITDDKETELINFINSQNWNTSISRRTQHYGYEYNYTTKDAKTKTTDVPNVFIELFNNIYEMNDNTQVIINEYTPMQGIAAHIDSRIFGNKIVLLSLGSPIAMTFSKGNESVPVLLPRRSLLIIEDDARYKWTHCITKKLQDCDTLDTVNKKLVDIKRITRLSITVRSMK